MSVSKTIQVLSLIASALVLGYGVFLSVGTYLAIGQVTAAAGQEAALGVFASTLGGALVLFLFAISVVFSIFALVPVVLKFFRVFGGSRALDVFAAVFCVFVTLAVLVIALSAAKPVIKTFSFVVFFISLVGTVLTFISSKID